MIRQLSYPVLISALTIGLPATLTAQESDDTGGGSMLENFLQDTLSGDDRNIRVTGPVRRAEFAGHDRTDHGGG